jgi:hypothetical protein
MFSVALSCTEDTFARFLALRSTGEALDLRTTNIVTTEASHGREAFGGRSPDVTNQLRHGFRIVNGTVESVRLCQGNSLALALGYLLIRPWERVLNLSGNASGHLHPDDARPTLSPY